MKIVLAYSGGLDTSVIVKWLRESYDAEIITFAADIGQEEELRGLSQKARRTGASRHYTLDLVDEFARDFIYPMIRANAVYEGQYHLGTSIARPLIAKAQVEVARANLKLARITDARWQELLRTKVVSKQEADQTSATAAANRLLLSVKNSLASF